MKRSAYIILINSLLLFCQLAIAGTGTQSSPLTIAEAKAKNTSSTTKYWVTGYIVGELESYSNNKWFFNMAPPFGGSVYLLADNRKECDLTKCVCLQFPTGSNGSDEYNLEDNPQYWRKKVLLQATREQYNNMDGLKKVTDFQVVSAEPINDESAEWDFFETFEDGSFTPTVAADKWQGGEFEVREYEDRYDNIGTVVRTWHLTNGIVDNGKPKWDDQCVSLRGQNATLELTTDHTDGIGEIEFWAGNYEDYGTAQLTFTLSVSTNQGSTWTAVVTNQQVAKSSRAVTNGMSLYRYDVNRTGGVRIKITKTDSNSGKGLQIDNIKMSRYNNQSTALTDNKPDADILLLGDMVEIRSRLPQRLMIFSTLGQCIVNRTIDGYYSTRLDKGMYIIRIGEKSQKIIVAQ